MLRARLAPLALLPTGALRVFAVPGVTWPVLAGILDGEIVATAGFAGVILVEATLAFLGIGRVSPYSWGALLDQGTTYLWKTQHIALAAGGCIAAVVLGANLLGDGLRDRLDPRQRGRM